MATTNFKIFNEANTTARTYTDEEYKSEKQRLQGVTPGMANSRLHNKMFFQWSSMTKAVADTLVAAGYDCNDNDVNGIVEGLQDMLAKAGTDTVAPIKDGTTPVAKATTADKATTATICTGNSATATKLQTARTISLTGAVTGSASFDGSANFTAITDGGLVGEIKWWPGTNSGHTLPSGFLLCDGSAISRTSYAGLWHVIGTTYGAGDGSTTFNLPNLIGRFIEGASSPGGYINAGLPNLYGWVNTYISNGDASDTWTNPTEGVFSSTWHNGHWDPYSGSGSLWLGNLTFQASDYNSIYGSSSTVQPPALCLKPIIRYAYNLGK